MRFLGRDPNPEYFIVPAAWFFNMWQQSPSYWQSGHLLIQKVEQGSPKFIFLVILVCILGLIWFHLIRSRIGLALRSPGPHQVLVIPIYVPFITTVFLLKKNKTKEQMERGLFTRQSQSWWIWIRADLVSEPVLDPRSDDVSTMTKWHMNSVTHTLVHHVCVT